jgi:hypothetical protein
MAVYLLPSSAAYRVKAVSGITHERVEMGFDEISMKISTANLIGQILVAQVHFSLLHLQTGRENLLDSRLLAG